MEHKEVMNQFFKQINRKGILIEMILRPAVKIQYKSTIIMF